MPFPTPLVVKKGSRARDRSSFVHATANVGHHQADILPFAYILARGWDYQARERKGYASELYVWQVSGIAPQPGNDRDGVGNRRSALIDHFCGSRPHIMRIQRANGASTCFADGGAGGWQAVETLPQDKASARQKLVRVDHLYQGGKSNAPAACFHRGGTGAHK